MSTTSHDAPKKSTSSSLEQVSDQLRDHDIKFLQLVFTDIAGMNKNVEVPSSQFQKALSGDVLFDGSSIDGFVRIEESDMLLQPDLATFRIYPWDEGGLGKVARVLCDVCEPSTKPFEGCPRTKLKNQLDVAKDLGYSIMAGPEAEFFLFELGEGGELTRITHDEAGYFDAAPYDLAENARREITIALQDMGLEIEAAHHEVAPGQHEIDFRYGDALETADNLVTLKYVVRRIALKHGLHATFMPKPIFGINGSGMHVHISLFDSKGETNLFADTESTEQISQTGKQFIAGVLNHARAICAITNPLINSFKRLVPDFEAPTHIAWSMRNRSPLIRIPERRGLGTRMELRMPDPSCNPYLAFAAIVASGLDGIKQEMEIRKPVDQNVYNMTEQERNDHKVGRLPASLNEAVDALEECDVIRSALGEHIFSHFVEAKRLEWREYIAQVHEWEVKKYLGTY